MQIGKDKVNFTFFEVEYSKILLLPPFLHVQFYFLFHLFSAFEAIVSSWKSSSLTGCV